MFTITGHYTLMNNKSSMIQKQNLIIIITTQSTIRFVLHRMIWNVLPVFCCIYCCCYWCSNAPLRVKCCTGNVAGKTGINDWRPCILHMQGSHGDVNDCLLASGAIMMKSAEHLVSFNEGSLRAPCGLLLCVSIKKSWRRWYNSCGSLL